MPVRVKNGNTAFQRLLYDFLKDYRQFPQPFVENIIVSSGGATYKEAVQKHLKHLRLVLQRLREKKLAVSADMANMLVEQVELAGPVVVNDGVKSSFPGKIGCLEKWNKAGTVSELLAFLGLANYYHKFVRLYARHAALLYSMPFP